MITNPKGLHPSARKIKSLELMGEDSSPRQLLRSSPGDDESGRPFICGVVEGFYGRPWTTDQRKELFRNLKHLGLNSYMYAPKDDFKHRAYWRELYSVEEADQLLGLITAAKDSGITFYYAISPGLDMVYSSQKDVSCLKRKLEQVRQFGCEAFAVLFDDIEPEISPTDKEVFQSFAQAQVSVSNEIYQTLNQPRFMFCPTEYCTARANPDIRNSDYLNTIGSKLLPGIDIMWTGSRVISKVITVESILELSEILKRPPVIWDNIHANDYDQKRIFLGPYSGRSTDLVPHLRGVLSNPNCEFEANFIPIHTLSQWSKCNTDAKSGLTSQVSADIRLETSESADEGLPPNLDANTYHPRCALKVAIRDWLPEFYKNKTAHGKSGHVVTAPLSAVVANLTVPPPINVDSDSRDGTGSNFIPIHKELVNSLVDPPLIINPILEPMDCVSSSPSVPSSPKGTSDTQMNSQVQSPISSDASDKNSRNESLEDMQTEPLEDEDNRLTLDDVSLLVDLFYLPFEHGTHGMQFLTEFEWLKANQKNFSSRDGRRNVTTPGDTNGSPDDFNEWKEKASNFDMMSKKVGKLLTRLTFIKNRSLLYDFYPYVWDIKGVISLLNSYIKWMGFSKGYKEAFSTGEQEPWLFRGGLTGELQRLLPLDSASDLFLYKAPESPSSHIFTIRPYLASDEESVYDVSCKNSEAGFMETDDSEMRDLLGSSIVGGFLCISPEFCFVVEDDVSICGYAVAALDAKQFSKRLEHIWIPDLRIKYPLPPVTPGTNGNHDDIRMMSRRDQIIRGIHSQQSFLAPESVLKTHPSYLRLDLMPHVMAYDSSVSKRLLTCVLAALKANGSKGVHLRLKSSEKPMIEFFTKLGFSELTQDIKHPDDHVLKSNNILFLGRSV